MARFMHGGVIGGLLPVSFAFVTRQFAPSNTATRTLSGLDFGPAVSGANRKYGLVAIWFINDATVNLSALSIGGVSGTQIFSATQAAMTFTGSIKIFVADISSVTSGSVSWTDDTAADYNVEVVTITNLDVTSVIDSAKGGGSNSISLALDVPAKGGVYGFANWIGGAPSSLSFANLTTFSTGTAAASSGSAGASFASAQTNISVAASLPSASFSGAFAVSFAGI